MEQWLEVLDPQGSRQFINPAHISRIALGDKSQEPPRIYVIMAQGDEITTHDPASIARIRQAAFTFAELDADHQSETEG